MKNFEMILKHKATGDIHKIESIRNHFGQHKYGYKLPDGNISTIEELIEQYTNVEMLG